MTFATKKLYVPGTVDASALGSETPATDRAIGLEQGGTGVPAAGANDAARAQDVLQTWGMLDGGLLVPLSLLRDMGGSSSGAAGSAGNVPQAAAGTQRQALRGDATFDTELEVSSVVKDDGTRILDVDSLGDADCRPLLVAGESSARRAQVGIRASTAVNADVDIDPLGSYGIGSVRGDPIQTKTRPLRRLSAIPFTATFDASGLVAPTISSPGAAAAANTQADGNYVELTYTPSGAAASVSIPSFIQRRHDPELIISWRADLIGSRLWMGLLSADPSGSDTLGATIGVAMRYNQATDGTTYKLVTSDGTSQNVVDTGANVAANALQIIRLRHIGSAEWEFSILDRATGDWTGYASSSVNGPTPSQTLGLWLTHDGTTSNSMSVAVVDLTAE